VSYSTYELNGVQHVQFAETTIKDLLKLFSFSAKFIPSADGIKRQYK